MWDGDHIKFDQNLCRLCGCTNNRLYNLQSSQHPGNSGLSTIEDMIKRLLPLKIDSKDKKPQQVCHNCVTTLEGYDSFVSMCLSTDVTFNNILQNIKTNQLDEKNSRNVIWVQDDKREPATEQSILLVSKTADSIATQNQDFYLMVELNYKEVEINPLIIDDNQTIVKESVNESSQNNKSNETDLSAKKKEKIKPFKCDICGKQLMRKSNLVTHLALHSKVKPHTCHECGKNFAKATDLNLHKHIHKGSYTCKTCNKCFVTRSKLERHSKSHSGVKDHACPICNKMFAEKNNMLVHMTLHTGERPYVCAVCNKTFRTHSRLLDHRRVHSTETPYKCMLCDKSFKWRTNLKGHIQKHAGEKFNCETCKKEFQVKSCFYKHRKECRKSVKNKTVICDFCSIIFSDEESCHDHIIRVHKIVQPN